jgi:hypothetical protein
MTIEEIMVKRSHCLLCRENCNYTVTVNNNVWVVWVGRRQFYEKFEVFVDVDQRTQESGF